MKIKHIFKILLSGIFVKIKAGPLYGKKWIVSSGGDFISGKQEPYKTEAFLKHFSPGEIFFDIGAHFGYFSSIAAVINKGNGKIFAFEPRPMNIRFFKKHMKINNFQNVTLIEAAAGESDGYVQFNTKSGSATGFVTEDGGTRVRQVCINQLVKQGKLPLPGFVKIDVEGGEIAVLRGMNEVIASSRPRMIIATHNPECHEFVIDFLKQNKYNFEILNPEHIKGDTEILALPG